MQIAHLLRKYNPAEWGGTETALQRLFIGFRQHGVESVVHCPRLENEPISDPLAEAGCRIERFRAFIPVAGISAQRQRQLISVGGNLMSFDLYAALRRNRNISVVHTHTLGRIGGIGRTIALNRNLPFVITIHGGVLDLPAHLKKDFNAPAQGWEWGKIFGLLLRSHRLFPDADAIVTCNVNEARLLREKYPSKRIVVQPHSVDVDVYRDDRRAAALETFPQLAGKRVLLCVGRIDSVKNQRWLVEQAPRVFQKFPDAMMVFAGACTDEEYGAELIRRIEELGLHDRILLTGGLPPNDPRLIGLLQLAKLLLVPSVSETFGLVILEAWAAGTPALSSRTSGATALVRHGENGWLFDLDNPATFHASLEIVMADSERSREVAQRGLAVVRTEFNVFALAGRLKRLYEELIEEKNALRHHSRRRYQCADAH